jgi:hypothetical protein
MYFPEPALAVLKGFMCIIDPDTVGGDPDLGHILCFGNLQPFKQEKQGSFTFRLPVQEIFPFLFGIVPADKVHDGTFKGLSGQWKLVVI